MREALFGILASAGAVESAHVLDLYAGSGALGIEALSRGARGAVLVESSRQAVAVIRQNLATLRLGDRAVVLVGDVARLTRRIARHGPFELVLADPPWAQVDGGEVSGALSALAAAGAVGERGWVVLEHSARTIPPDVGGLSPTETRRYGDTALTFYKPAILGAPRTDVHARPPSD